MVSNTSTTVLTTLLNSTVEKSLTSEADEIHVIVSLGEKVIEALLLSTIWFFAFSGNILLWMVILKNKSLRSTSNALVLCLSSADLTVAIVNLPVTISTIIFGEWKLGDQACTAWGFFNMLTFVGSVMTLGVISLNRYVLIVHQQRFRTIYTRKYTGFMILGKQPLLVLHDAQIFAGEKKT